jgi:hypothetical protein
MIGLLVVLFLSQGTPAPSAHGRYGEEAPSGSCGPAPSRSAAKEVACRRPMRARWVCRKWYNGDFWSGSGWVAECR